MEYICYGNSCYALAVFSDYKGNGERLSFGGDFAIGALIIIEFLFMAFFAGFLLVVAIIVGQSSVFHNNMLRIAAFLIVHLYFYIVTRMVLFLYQARIIVPPVNGLGFIGALIVIMSVIRCYVAYAVAFVLLAFVIERLFATMLRRDYEQVKRSWIASMEILIVSTAAMLLSLDTTFTNLVLVVLASLIAGVIAICLYFHNRQRLSAMINHNTRYTLPERYQLDENIKAFKFLLTIAVPGAAFIGGLFMLLIARILLRFNRQFYFISGAAFDTGVAVSLSVWGLIVFFLQPTWREMFRHEVYRLINRKWDRAPKVTRTSIIDANVYFESLKSAWDSPIPK